MLISYFVGLAKVKLMALVLLSDPVWLALIAGLVGLPPTVIGLVNAWTTYRIKIITLKNEAHIAEVRSAVVDVEQHARSIETHTNGMHSAAIESARKLAEIARKVAWDKAELEKFEALERGIELGISTTKGTTGPAGATGEQGPSGEQGIPGPQGTPGRTGQSG